MATWPILEFEVQMCCNTCVEKVEDVVNGMHGVDKYEINRWNNLLTITQTPYGIRDHKQLLKKLKKASHDKKAKLLQPRAQRVIPTPNPTGPTHIVYTQFPSMQGLGYLVPLSPSTPSSSIPFVTNPSYLKHPVRCGHCWRYSDLVCANCGRGSHLG